LTPQDPSMNRVSGRISLATTLFMVAAIATAQTTVPRQDVPVRAADATAEAIRERVDQLRYELQFERRDPAMQGEAIVLGELVARYYESQQFRPQWRDAARLDQLHGALLGLRDDGLDPSDYHLAALDAFRTRLRQTTALPPGEQAALEMLATDATMLGLYHLYLGKVDPVRLSSQWNFASRPVDVERGFVSLTKALESGQIRETFARARPQHVWYERGRERLKDYRTLAAAGGWPTLPEGPTLKPGMADARVAILRERLRITKDDRATGAGAGAGALAAVAQATAGAAAAQPATVAPAADCRALAPGPDCYDAGLEAAVRRFQDRHGLEVDGAVGPATRTALNVSVQARIDQIRLNLERARWVLHEVKGDLVLVNVAGFEVSYFRDDEPVWTSKVIVGRPYRETPIFKSLITYVVFNPTWTIPPTILVKDKLPVIQRDPGYLDRNGIRVIDSQGRVVDAHSVDWSRYGRGRLPPYQLRQDPGEDNALGRVKIMFPNPYMVYLHDTPSKSLFDRDERTFSSGCIRVEKPFELAERVLGDPARWNPQTIAGVLATGESQTVNLARPIPVLILYWTAQPRPDGQVIFRNDVYGRDPATLAALDSPFTAPRGGVPR
jgi:murein L,D-transpeptidase YcbB/YkuD